MTMDRGSVYSPPLSAWIDQYDEALGTDGGWEMARQNRDHALQINDRQGLVDKWTRDGRVFIANNGTIGTPETMSAAGTAFTLTAPSIIGVVPAGSTYVLIHAQVSGTRVITKDDLFGVFVSEGNKYTSGGNVTRQAVAKNAVMNGDGSASLRTSGMLSLFDSDTAIVAAALSNPRILKRIKHEGVAGEVDAPWEPEYNILKGDPLMYLRGPATILVFAVQETTAMEAEWSMSWAELSSGTVS